MSAYGHLADFYDRLTEDVDYGALADFYQRLITRGDREPGLLLDLACGTGSLTGRMAERGYDLIGVDASPEMLSAAREKGGDILYLQQELTGLDLYGTVDAAICSLDGMNYVPPGDMDEVLRRVFLFLHPGGVFAFDLNSAEKLMGLDGELFADEREDLLCLWRCAYDGEERACYYQFDLFVRRPDGLWARREEEHVEYAYSVSEMEAALTRAGFCDIRVWGDRRDGPPEPGEERIFFSAAKPPEGEDVG